MYAIEKTLKYSIMNKNYLLLCTLILVTLVSCEKESMSLIVTSPNESNQIIFNLSKEGQPTDLVTHYNKKVVDTSYMSFDIKYLSALKGDFKIVNSTTATADETWQMPWGEQLDVSNNYNELIVNLEDPSKTKRKLYIHKDLRSFGP